MIKKNPQAKSHLQFITEVKELYGDEYSVLSLYYNNKTKITVRHNSPRCNYHILYPRPDNFLANHGCEICSHSSSTSFAEQFIYLLLKTIIPEIENSVKFDNRECDMYIPLLNVGIQYDGYRYHQDTIKDNSFNDLFFQKGGILLIRIREQGCPAICERDNLILINRENSYTRPKALNRICREIIRIINQKTNSHYPMPSLPDETLCQIEKKANERVIATDRYDKLLNELISFYCANRRLPVNYKKRDSYERKLAGRIYYAKKRHIFPENLIDFINTRITDNYSIRQSQ